MKMYRRNRRMSSIQPCASTAFECNSAFGSVSLNSRLLIDRSMAGNAALSQWKCRVPELFIQLCCPCHLTGLIDGAPYDNHPGVNSWWEGLTVIVLEEIWPRHSWTVFTKHATHLGPSATMQNLYQGTSTFFHQAWCTKLPQILPQTIKISALKI